MLDVYNRCWTSTIIMPKKNIKVSKSTKDTYKIAQDFLTKISKVKNRTALIVGLYGDLGAGKTTFTQMATRIFGVKRKVNSPTFVIMQKYSIPKSKYKFLFHLDAYRLKNDRELINLGWEEIISNKEHLVFIEWPENVIKVMPQKHHKIKIFHTPAGHRKFQILEND